ncbi:MAG: Gldg family protein [Chthoniobacterales bacterium]
MSSKKNLPQDGAEDSVPKKEEAYRIPRFRMGVGLLIQAVLLVVVLGLINYISFHYYKRFDFSRSQHFRLAVLTQQSIRQLKQPLKVIVYFSPTSVSPESMVATDVANLLKELQFAGKKNMEIEYIDPMRNLERARQLQTEYKFAAEDNFVLLVYDGRSKFVPISEMVDIDMTPAMTGGQPRIISFKGEQAFTSALISLLDPEFRKIYVTTGHGESSFEENGDMGVLASYTKRLNAEIVPLNLGANLKIPDDAAIIIIAGARFDFSPQQIELLKNYWKGDGRILLLLDPDSKTPRLDAFSAELGVLPLDQRVLRTIPLGFATGILRDVAGEFLPDSDIAKRLRGVNAAFPSPVQPLLVNSEETTSEGSVVRPLIRAHEEYWGESEYVTDESKGVRYDDGEDSGFPIILAASVRRSGIQDQRVEVDAAKMIVVGNSLFATNDGLGGPNGSAANLDFLVSGLNWLMDRSKLTGIAPKAPREFLFSLSDQQISQISLYTMIVIPGAAGFLGLLVWLRRRR